MTLKIAHNKIAKLVELNTLLQKHRFFFLPSDSIINGKQIIAAVKQQEQKKKNHEL